MQIKPQLEQLLNLPVDSLTKEIKLTQELQLFLFGAALSMDNVDDPSQG